MDSIEKDNRSDEDCESGEEEEEVDPRIQVG